MDFRAVGAAVLALLATPAVASGAVRCVDGPGGACDTNHATIQLAVTAAADGDTIRIAPGLYPESIDTAKRLTFDGAGPGTFAAFDSSIHTRIRPNTIGSGTAPAGLRMSGGGTVRDIRLDGGGTTDTAGRGLALVGNVNPQPEVYAVSNVLATHGAGNAFGQTAIEVSDEGTGAAISASISDVVTQGGMKFEGLNVSLELARVNVSTDNFFVLGVFVTEGAEGTLRDSRIQKNPAVPDEASRAVEVSDGAKLTVERTTIVTDFNAFRAGGDNAVLTVRDSSSFTSNAPSGGGFIGGAIVSADGAPARISLIGSTLVSVHQAGDGGVKVDGDAAFADLRNTVVRSISDQTDQADLTAIDGGRITAANSAFRTRYLATGGSAPAPGSPTNVAGDALFSSLAPGGLGLQPGSPLIDAGDASAVTAGEKDLAGATRSLDGNGDCTPRPDIGAFERPATSPPLCFQAVRITGARASNKTFAPVKRGGKVAAKRRKRKKPKRGTRFRYALSEAATVRIVIERITKGRRISVKGKRVCAKPTRKRRKRRRCNRYKRVTTLTASQTAGPQSIPFTGRVKGKALKAGKYRARITATDRQGARSIEKRLALKIVKP